MGLQAVFLREGLSMVLVAACLFGAAGRFDLPWLWAYMALLAVPFAVGPLILDSGLLKERMRPGGKPLSRKFLLLFVPAAGQWIVAGLDVGRYHWTGPLPVPVQATGFLLAALAMALTLWAMRVNRFFSSVIRIQTDRGHRVIDTGPYRWVRHPGYAAALLHVATGGVALGSLPAILPQLAMVPLLLYRSTVEDRILRRELPGYAEYSERVRFRIVPGIW